MTKSILTKKEKELKRNYSREWRNNNKERINEYHKKWAKDNPDKIKQYTKNYWAKKVKESEDNKERMEK